MNSHRGIRCIRNTFIIMYSAVVCSALTFGVVCWGGNVSKHERRD